MKLRIPSSLQIGDRNIVVVLEKDLHRTKAVVGSWDPSSCIITLDRDVAEEQRGFHTFIHEIIEAVNGLYYLDIPHQKIDVLDIGISQALLSAQGDILADVKQSEQPNPYNKICKICKTPCPETRAMSLAPESEKLDSWLCPVCEFGETYSYAPYTDILYKCDFCSVTFTEPQNFNKLWLDKTKKGN